MSQVDTIKDQVRGQLQVVKDNARMAGRLEAFRVVYEKADRILSGHPVRVAMALDGNAVGLGSAPGWTDGETIFLNAEVIKNDLGHLPMKMIVLHTKAVNYHELAHVMFTPRQRDDIFKWVIRQCSDTGDRRWFYAFNALEDQRIETFFTAKYKPAAHYFEVIALKWLVNNSPYMAESYILVHGRKFLSSDLVAKSRAAFVARYGEDLADRFSSCIDDFLKVRFPGDTLLAQKCILRYFHLMNEMQQLHPTSGGTPTPSLPSADNGGADGPSGQNDPTVIRKNNARVKDQTKARDSVDDVTPRVPKPQDEGKYQADPSDRDDDLDADDDDLDGDAVDADVEADSDADGDSGDGEGSGSSQGDGQTEGNSADDQTDQSSTTEASSGGGGAGSAEVGSQTEAEAALDAVYDALDELFADESFQKELEDTAESIRQAMSGEGVANGADVGSQDVALRPSAIQAAKKMSLVLSRMRSELEEQHLRRQTAGQIDMRRFATRNPWDVDFFKTWDPGQDENTDLEAVLLVDLSGSMASYMNAVSESLWTVKRALESLDSRVTVLGFSEQSYVLYQPTEKVDRTRMRLFNSRSSTYPDAALQEAHRLFRASNRSQKLLVSITDGAWQGNASKQAAFMKAMHQEGVISCIIGIGYAPQGEAGRNNHMIHHHLPGIEQMPKVALDIVQESLKALASNGAMV